MVSQSRRGVSSQSRRGGNSQSIRGGRRGVMTTIIVSMMVSILTISVTDPYTVCLFLNHK